MRGADFSLDQLDGLDKNSADFEGEIGWLEPGSQELVELVDVSYMPRGGLDLALFGRGVEVDGVDVGNGAGDMAQRPQPAHGLYLGWKGRDIVRRPVQAQGCRCCLVEAGEVGDLVRQQQCEWLVDLHKGPGRR